MDKEKTYKRTRGNGTGSAYKRGKKWMCAATVGWKDGRPIMRTKGGFATKREALAYLPQLYVEQIPPQSLQYYHDVWDKSARLKLSESKQTAYRIAWGRLKALHKADVSKLTVGALQAVISDSAPSHYTARDCRTLLSNLFKLAIADQRMTVNLAQYIVIPELDETEPVPFTADEVRLIWAAYEQGDDFAPYVLLMIYTGMMPGELQKCTREMIHLDSMEIVGAGLKTKERKKRPIVLANFIVPVVERILERTAPEPDARIAPMGHDQLYAMYADFKRRVGLRDLPMYACRHTTATALATSTDVVPSVIQRIMRHTRFTTTERYIHPDDSDAHSGVNQLRPS